MKTAKVIGLLALVFIAGFVGGVEATRIVFRYMVAHPNVPAVRIESLLDRKLRLDAPQRQKVHEILKDSREKRRSVMEDFQPKFNAAVLETRSNIVAVLRPDQQERFAQFLDDNRQFLAIRELPPQKKPSQTNLESEAHSP
jgi:hypothetical protein